MTRALKWTGLLVLLVLGVVLLANLYSLDDGLRYVWNMLTYNPTPAHPLDPGGPFGFREEYVTLRNAQRERFITNYLDARGIPYQRLPIYNSGFDNVLILFGARGPYT